MEPRRLVLTGLAVLVAVLGIYLVLVRGTADPASDDASAGREGPAASPPPALRGSGEEPQGTGPGAERAAGPREAEPEAAVPPRRGRVVDAAGRPVEGARIYLVRKGRKGLGGAHVNAAPLALTDADGAWQVEGISMAGHWIGARAGEHVRPALLDGDALGEGELELQLPDSALLRVTTRLAEGELPEGSTMAIVCSSPVDADAWPFPAPETPFAFKLSWPIEELGVTSIPLPHDGPVEVRFESFDVYAVPTQVVVDDLPTAVHFDLHPKCSLDVRVLGTEDGRPLRVNLQVAVGDPTTPVGSQGWLRIGAWPTQEGIVAHPLGLRPGTYQVRVKGVGYREAVTEVTFEQAGEHQTVEVRLENAPEVGILRLKLAHEIPTDTATVFVTAMRPAAGGPWRSKPAAARTGLEEGVTQIDIEGLTEGAYDVMVWMRPTLRVGYAMSVAIHGGVETTESIRLDEGQPVELARERTTDVFVRLEAPPLGNLPLIHFYGTSYSVSDGRVGPTAPDPGPYPFPEIETQVSPRPIR